MKTLWLLSVISTMCQIGFCGNILILLPTTVPSHLSTFKFLIKALADEHNVVFYGLPLKLAHKNVTEKTIHMMSGDSFLGNLSANVFKTTCKKSGIQVIMNEILWINFDYFNQMFLGKDIQDLLKTNNTFDLMITVGHTAEFFYPFAARFNIPLVQFSTSFPLPWLNELIGNPTFYASDLSFVTYETPTNFWQRLTKFIKHSIIILHYNWLFIPLLNKVTKQHFPPEISSIEESSKNTALIFMNYESKMGFARANVPAAVEVGGLHCVPAKPLPPDLEEFMQSSGEHGVIYFSLGSTLKGSALPENVRKDILEVFSKLSQKVLWKWEGSMSDLPANVKISKWIPQQDVLGHEKIRLFITQGGILSIQEAAYHGVPILTMPLLLDQYTNAAIAEQNGYGLQIDYCNFNKDEFHYKIVELLQNPRYSKTIKEISMAVKDNPCKSADKIKWWIRYILKHKNTKNLKPLHKMSYFEHSEIDIHIFLFIISSLIFFAVIIACRKCIALWNKKIYISKIKPKQQ